MAEDQGKVKIYEALSRAQAEVQEVRKNAKNPHYGSDYADLAEIVAAIKKPMADNGLSIVESCPVEQIGERFFAVHMKLYLFHVGGEQMWVETHIPCMKGDRMDAQSIGSAITYGRRYLIQNMFNIAAEPDDDGESIIDDGKRSPSPTPAKKTPSRPPETPQNGKLDVEPSFQGIVKIVNSAKEYGIPSDVLPKIMSAAGQVKSKGGSEEEYTLLIELIKDGLKTDNWGEI